MHIQGYFLVFLIRKNTHSIIETQDIPKYVILYQLVKPVRILVDKLN